MFNRRRKATTSLPAAFEEDHSLFNRFALEVTPHLRAGNAATLSSKVAALSDVQVRSIMLAFTERMAEFSSPDIAKTQSVLPWVDTTSAWGETHFHALRSHLSFISVSSPFDLSQELTVSYQAARPSYHLFSLLANRAARVFNVPELKTLQERGLNPFMMPAWSFLPDDYPSSSYRFDSFHRELVITPKADYSTLTSIFSTESREGDLWKFTREKVGEWNSNIIDTVGREPEALNALNGVFPDEEIENPQIMATFIGGIFAQDIDMAAGQAYERYTPTRQVSDCYRQINVSLGMTSKPQRVPVTVSFEGDEVCINATLCREEFLQASSFLMVERIYVDRIVQGLDLLSHLHPATKFAADELKRF